MPRLSIAIGVTNSGTPQSAPARTYLYIATGSDLSPNINNLRFYDTGLTSNGQPIYYDETDTYKMQFGGFPWVINFIEGGLGTFAKFAGSGPTGSYSSAGGWTGTVTISAI